MVKAHEKAPRGEPAGLSLRIGGDPSYVSDGSAGR